MPTKNISGYWFAYDNIKFLFFSPLKIIMLELLNMALFISNSIFSSDDGVKSSKDTGNSFLIAKTPFKIS